MRIALFGSPAFAVPVLDALQKTGEVVAVVTQPAKPVGRGLKLNHPPLARRAMELDIPLQQPHTLRRNDAFLEWLRSLELDVAVTAAYGKILPADVLQAPQEGILNVHGSLLPRWRGAAPVQWALIAGDTRTGISVMQTETGVDTGPVRHVRAVDIGPDETAPELFGRLSQLGATAISEALELLAAGRLPSVPQDEALATHARMLVRADGLMDFSRSAEANYNRYRGVKAWPGSHFPFRGDEIKVHGMKLMRTSAAIAGEVLDIRAAGVLVACGEDALLLQELQVPGKKRVQARDWANGLQLRQGDMLAREE